MNLRIIGLICIVLLNGTAFGQERFKFKATLDKDTIYIGEQVNLKLEFDFSKRLEQMGWPHYEENMITDKIEIVNATPIDSIMNPNSDSFSWSQILSITSFDTGRLTIPQIPIAYKNLFDTTVLKSYTDSMYLFVRSVDADTTKAFKDITMPRKVGFSLSEIIGYVMWGFIAILVIVIGYLIYRHLKSNKRIIPVKEVPDLDPDVEALIKLDKLRRAKIWQDGRVKEYYTELTDIIRVYVERRFEVQAVEMTSEEIIEGLKIRLNNEEAIGKLALTFDTADLVKFAKFNPIPLENDLCLQRCIDFVNETKLSHVK